MGRGIAQLLVQAGHAVRLFDARDGAAADARNLVIKVLERIAAKGSMSKVGLADCAPATLQWAVDAVHYLLAADGTPVTTITDSPGFVSQRIIAMIVNISCEIAQRGIASAHEIDPAYALA